MSNVFLSHSGKDKAVINRIKDKLQEICQNELPIFLSSDGQSLKLGRNWIAQIETALKDSNLMFVFLSEYSAESPWVLFELGHAYGRTIDVVPIGLPGVDISKLPQPICFIQGFNIINHESLNNIVVKINECFSKSYLPGFNKDDFESIFSESLEHSFRNIYKHVSSIVFYLTENLKYSPQKILSESHRIFINKKIPAQLQESVLNLEALQLIHETATSPERVLITLMPSLSGENIDNFDFIINGTKNNGYQGLKASIFFQNSKINISEPYKIISKTRQEGIEFAQDRGLLYKNLKFEISPSSSTMTITILDTSPPFESLNSLIEILYENNIILPD